MAVTEEIERLAVARASSAEIARLADRAGDATLRQDGWAKVTARPHLDRRDPACRRLGDAQGDDTRWKGNAREQADLRDPADGSGGAAVRRARKPPARCPCSAASCRPSPSDAPTSRSCRRPSAGPRRRRSTARPPPRRPASVARAAHRLRRGAAARRRDRRLHARRRPAPQSAPPAPPPPGPFPDTRPPLRTLQVLPVPSTGRAVTARGRAADSVARCRPVVADDEHARVARSKADPELLAALQEVAARGRIRPARLGRTPRRCSASTARSCPSPARRSGTATRVARALYSILTPSRRRSSTSTSSSTSRSRSRRTPASA